LSGLSPYLRLWHTVRHLRAGQVLNRVTRKLPRPGTSSARRAVIRPRPGAWVAPAPKHAAYVAETQVRFLNQTRSIAGAGAWRPPDASALWTYHLHYFDDMNASDAAGRERWHRMLMDRWIDENPRSARVAWDPYPISLRAVNWIKWQLAGNSHDQRVLDSLHAQLQRLHSAIEYHLLGNHVFENAKALLFGGSFFAGEQADRWFATGAKLLQRELREQVLEDGGHFELSPMYHAIVLEGVLDLVNLGRAYERRELLALDATVAPMLRWLDCMTHPDGEFALFNDTAFAHAPSFAEVREYARRLGLDRFRPRDQPLQVLPQSGYARVSLGAFEAFLDIGQIGPDHQPGHAHADTLSFELSCGGNRVFVNSGTSLYEPSEERTRQRSTAAHNTAVLDGCNSSDVWSAFRVGRRARVYARKWETEPGRVLVEAAHDGFSHLPGRPSHLRRWSFGAEHVSITDEIAGRGEHSLQLSFHLHPQIGARFAGDREVVLSRSGVDIGRMTFAGSLDWRLADTSYHPGFGVSVPTLKVVGGSDVELPARVATKFESA
jgi:uncharacterized heparinase superfamily protein